MSEDIVKTLLESLTDEQKAKLVEGLVAGMNQTVSKPPAKETKQEEAVSSKTPTVTIGEDFRVTNTRESNLTRGKQPVRAKRNSWKDTGEHKLDEDEQEWSAERQRTSRNRPKAKKVEVECSSCGRTFMERPELLFGQYHRCNRCGGR